MKHLTTLLLTLLVLGGCSKETHLRCVVINPEPDSSKYHEVTIKKNLFGEIVNVSGDNGTSSTFEDSDERISWNDYAGWRYRLNKVSGMMKVFKKDAQYSSIFNRPDSYSLSECSDFKGLE